jgi:peptide/nickel transport system ATP-binding protein
MEGRREVSDATMTLVDRIPPPRTPEVDDQTVLRVENLTVSYATPTGPLTAVRNATFDISRGERIALVGESGSGKTTLGLAIAGFVGPAQGATVTRDVLEFQGRSLERKNKSGIPSRTPGISMMFQDAMTSLDPVAMVGKQLRDVLRAGGQTARGDVKDMSRDWLTRVGLHDTERVMKSRPYELSGGMRQRVMLAIALCGKPSLLIADEPTSALDASLSRGAMELIVELASSAGTALLVVSHDIKLCQEYVDQLFVMYHGEIVERGASGDLAETATHPYTIGLMQCIPTLATRNAERLPTLADFMQTA